MKKSKYFLLLLPIVIFGFLIYKCSQFLNRIENTDYEYNTVYSDNYSDKSFNNYLIGKSEKDILEMFGQPIKKEKLLQGKRRSRQIPR